MKRIIAYLQARMPQGLRGQFTLLLLGGIIIPFILSIVCVFAAVAIFEKNFADNPVLTYIEMSNAVMDNLEQIMQGNYAPEKLRIPANTSLMIRDGEEVVVNEGKASLDNGSVLVLQLELPERTIHYHASSASFQADMVQVNRNGDRINYWLSAMMIGLTIFMILFSLIVSMLIISNINRRLSQLAQASHTIATGNLDFKLEATGKDTITKLTESFDSMRQQLQKEMAKRARLFMAFSHDLKTPLAAIDGYVDALEDGFADTPEKQQQFFHIIKAQTTLLNQRVLAQLRFAELQSSEIILQRETQSLSALLEEFIAMQMPIWQAQSFHVSVAIADDSAMLEFDEALMLRVLENLASNAVKFADARKRLAFRLVHADNTITLSIDNSHAGLSDEALELIFEPFYRVDSSRNSAGTGLGLSSAKSIVEAHGWKLEAYSEADAYVRLCIVIPI